MTKEWKCTDCVKYKTDACSTCACGYIPTVSCRDVLVDFDYAYQQGRADAIDDVIVLFKRQFDKQNNKDSKFVPTVVFNELIFSILEQLKEQTE